MASLAFFTIAVLLIASLYAGLQHYFLDQKAELLDQTEAILGDKRSALLEQARGRESVVDMDAIVNFSTELKKLNQREAYGINLNRLSEVLAKNPGVKVEALSWEPIASLDDAMVKVSLRGQVYPFLGQYKPMNELLDQLVKDIEQQDLVEGGVQIIRQPFNQQQARNFRMSPGTEVSHLPFAIEWQQRRSLDLIKTKVD
jgi:hypothetical protein